VRFGLLLEVTDGDDPLPGLTRQAQAAEDSGFDLVWVQEAHGVPWGLPSPMVVASMLAPLTSALRVAVDVQAGVHPVYLAEEAAVADLSLGGRLVLGVGHDGGDVDLLAETVDVLLAAQAARPFRHEGQRWRIPANLPANEFNLEERVRVTPAPAQLELPTWITGPAAPDVALDRGLCHVGAATEDAATLERRWRATEARLGAAAGRLRRPALRALATGPDGRFDDEALVARLRDEQRRWGMDVVVLQLPRELSVAGRERAVDAVARRVRPRVQLDRLPVGLEEFWRDELHGRLDRARENEVPT